MTRALVLFVVLGFILSCNLSETGPSKADTTKAVAKKSCIYNDAPYGLGTQYRLDSIVGAETDGIKPFLYVTIFNAADFPISLFVHQRGSSRNPGGFPIAFQLEFRDGVIIETQKNGDSLTQKVRRQHLNAEYLVDSTTGSFDGGATFFVDWRYFRSGDTLKSESAIEGSKALWTMKIDYPAGDSTVLFHMIQDRYELAEVCRPIGDTCKCEKLLPMKDEYEYVVEHGLLKYSDSYPPRRRYVWRKLE